MRTLIFVLLAVLVPSHGFGENWGISTLVFGIGLMLVASLVWAISRDVVIGNLVLIGLGLSFSGLCALVWASFLWPFIYAFSPSTPRLLVFNNTANLVYALYVAFITACGILLTYHYVRDRDWRGLLCLERE